ncbi:hypothetical protein CWI38_2175p0010 [Hamiltosporidium tvaerminnensis]|uniref:Uncharacterized protein n=1 Tax=Hamiltosporidium tvaerminnensis TaxID=1176355 RepID=A0A4Q9LNU2_9MICR|nr:hypothetical protein CWI38_2175p0010 [Hamiltosporidium tvaerminnensis]
MYLEIPYEIGENDEVKECFDKLELDIKDQRKEKVIQITSFCYNKIKEYTNVKFHPFILYFTTYICYFVYRDMQFDVKKYRPELLFNLITFGRFWNKKDYNILKEKHPKICRNIENSLNQDNKIDIFVLENTKFIKGYSSEASKSKISINLANATVENYFGFFLIINQRFFKGKEYRVDITRKSAINKSTISFLELKIMLEKTTGCINLFSVMIDFESYKEIAENISEPIFRTILKDSNFSLEFIENIVKKKEINYIKSLYVFLKNISKTEYHEYIAAVLGLKAFCFKEILRSVLEILFLADVLNIEFEKINNNPSIINTYGVPFIAVIKNYLDEQRIEYDKNLVLNTFNHFLLPRTFSILKTFIFVNLFANSSWKGDYNKELKEYFTKNKKNVDEEVVVNEKNIILYVFEQEFSKLSPEERKKIFTIPVTKTPISDNKN